MALQLRASLINSDWDWGNSVGRVRLLKLARKPEDSWRFNPIDFTLRQPQLQDLAIERKASLLPGAGLGMFAKRSIQEGEYVCRYNGTIKELTADEAQQLLDAHAEDGNGVFQLHSAGEKQVRTPEGKTFWLDPYEVDGRPVSLEDAIGVWANHKRAGTLGCTLKAEWVRDAYHHRWRQVVLLRARCYIPRGTELCFDYGERDPNFPWL